jgi:cell division transport system permease protein
MNAWLRQHRQAAASALRRLGVLNTLVIGVALSLPAGGYALLESLRDVAARLSLDPQVTVFLHPSAKRAEADAVGKALRADRRIAEVRFVPREQALKDLSAVQGLPEVLAALGHNPLPDAFIVVTARGEALEKLSSEIAALPGVAHVQADAAWARRLSAMAQTGRLAIWLLSALLGAGLVAVTFNTIRLQILTQREEIEVAKLIGATDAFIRRPFYYLGLLQGAAGGLVALGIVSASLLLLNREVRAVSESYGSSFGFGLLGTGDSAALVLFAGLLGILGAQLSVSRHLREIEPK